MRPVLLLALAFAALTPRTAVAAETREEVRYAAHLADLVNQYRARNGLRPLTLEPALDALARQHSVAMAAAKRLSHDEFPSRVRRSGHAMCVENVGFNYRSPESQFEGWRGSAGHDRNMLDKRVDRMGIGVAADYVTLIACL